MSIDSGEKVAILHEAAGKVINQRNLRGFPPEHHANTSKRATSNLALTWHHSQTKSQHSNSSRPKTHQQHFNEKPTTHKRRSASADASPSIHGSTDICALHLGTTGCSNISLKFKDPSALSFSPGSLEASGDKKHQAGDYPGAINDYGQLIERYPEIPRGYTSEAQKKIGFTQRSIRGC